MKDFDFIDKMFSITIVIANVILGLLTCLLFLVLMSVVTGCEKKDRVKTKCVKSHIENRLRTYYSNGQMRYTFFPTTVCDEWEIVE